MTRLWIYSGFGALPKLIGLYTPWIMLSVKRMLHFSIVCVLFINFINPSLQSLVFTCAGKCVCTATHPELQGTRSAWVDLMDCTHSSMYALPFVPDGFTVDVLDMSGTPFCMEKLGDYGEEALGSAFGLIVCDQDGE